MTFPDLRPHSSRTSGVEESFWPSFTDIMMVIVMIFLISTSLLIIKNWRLIEQMQAAIAKEAEANELVLETNQENLSLEERLAQADYINSQNQLKLIKLREERQGLRDDIEQTIASLKGLQESKEAVEAQLAFEKKNSERLLADKNSLIEDLTGTRKTIGELTVDLQQLSVDLAEEKSSNEDAQRQLSDAQSRLLSSDEKIAAQKLVLDTLRQNEEESTIQYVNLQGEYDTLKQQYDKLFKPARTTKDKFVVTLRYSKEQGNRSIKLRVPGDSGFREVTEADMNAELSTLKLQHGSDLYVKVIFPEESELSYNEAWSFTNSILEKYDYYYQQ